MKTKNLSSVLRMPCFDGGAKTEQLQICGHFTEWPSSLLVRPVSLLTPLASLQKSVLLFGPKMMDKAQEFKKLLSIILRDFKNSKKFNHWTQFVSIYIFRVKRNHLIAQQTCMLRCILAQCFAVKYSVLYLLHANVCPPIVVQIQIVWCGVS